MYGVAWLLIAAIIVVGGLVIAFALTAWAPIFALVALAIAATIGFAYLGGKRTRIGTERERIDRGEIGATPSRDAAAAEGEGARRSAGDDERYEPAL